MQSLQLYHNNRCSKSRAALALLQQYGLQAEVIDYLHTAPDKDELRTLLTLLRLPAQSLLRSKEAIYAQLQLEQASDEQILDAIATHPMLLERPIISNGQHAMIVRTPESLQLFCQLIGHAISVTHDSETLSV